MGSLCSKQSASTNAVVRQNEMTKSHQKHDHGEVHNVIHSNNKKSSSSSSHAHDQHAHSLHSNHQHNYHGEVRANYDSITTTVLGDYHADDKKGIISMITCPPTEALLCRFWIYKRGHLVRTWKKRYCVLDKSDLKYYAKDSKEPPYGKGYKGKVALLGAVCLTQTSADNKHIEVEIYGNHGEKDLFFYVENTIKGEEFVRLLQWAIRKATLTMLVRNLKTTISSKTDEKLACKEWKEHQNILYESSIRSLQYSQIYHFVAFEENGAMIIRPGILRLWTAFGNKYTPTLQTESNHMGLGWKYIEQSDANKLVSTQQSNFRPESFLMSAQAPAEEEEFDDIHILTFEDILDVTYKFIDPEACKALRPHMKAFHHDPDCPAQKFMLVTLQSNFGHNLHILCCCMNDYDQSLTSLSHILLFLQARSKLLQATAVSDKNQNHGNMTAAAKAMRLLEDEE